MSKKRGQSGEVRLANVARIHRREKAGLKDGDIISQVDGKNDFKRRSEHGGFPGVKGEKRTDVVLHVLREGEELEPTATRDDIETQTVHYEMKDEQTGYIAVREFDDALLTNS